MAEMPFINIEFNGPTKIEIYQMLGPHPMLPIVMDIAPWDMMGEVIYNGLIPTIYLR